ncbi:MAG TPA: glutathione S-transferase N-terminal domain-containing protein [Devosia sp.]|nr:glutathione S-transferase N-terminal domain-containing protein [Devosia sp.]
MLKVLGRITSINVRKVLWALDEMAIAHEREDWGLPVRDPNVPEFLRLNPNAQVPVIVDDGFVLWESGAVLRYLGDKAGSDLWPRSAEERARVDQWLTWQGTELGPSWAYAVQALLRGNPPNPDPARIAASVMRWTAAMRILEGQLAAGSGFVANGRMSLADIVMGLSTHRWLSLPIDRPALPAVEAHHAAMAARPAAARYLGEGTP